MKNEKYKVEIIITGDDEKIIKWEEHENVSEIDIDYDTEIENGEAIVKQIRLFVRR